MIAGKFLEPNSLRLLIGILSLNSGLWLEFRFFLEYDPSFSQLFQYG